MVSSVFKQAVKETTGTGWDEWIVKLERTIDPVWSHERMKAHICETFHLSDEWGEWLAVMYGQRLGRTPVGVTKDAGVQIGVRKTLAATKEQLWDFLISPRGLSLWIGTVSHFQPQKGFEFASAEGVVGKLTVVQPFRKLRMTWKRPEWDRPSRLQIGLLPTNTGKTTVAFHQEMLEDVYIRELMRRFWEETLRKIENETIPAR
jgi:uncharacterized protein YndB with AHSA1/START domain